MGVEAQREQVREVDVGHHPQSTPASERSRCRGQPTGLHPDPRVAQHRLTTRRRNVGRDAGRGAGAVGRGGSVDQAYGRAVGAAADTGIGTDAGAVASVGDVGTAVAAGGAVGVGVVECGLFGVVGEPPDRLRTTLVHVVGVTQAPHRLGLG